MMIAQPVPHAEISRAYLPLSMLRITLDASRYIRLAA